MSVNATQVPQSTDLVGLLTLVGTWALVLVASITVAVTAWQTRKGQRLLNKQVEESIGQTRLQQQQFTESLNERETPRIAELIRKVLTPAIGWIQFNNNQRTRSYLAEEGTIHDTILERLDMVAAMALDSFESTYPDFAGRFKTYDERIIDLRKLRSKFIQLLISRVQAVVPSILKESNLPPEWRVGELGYPSVDVVKIVTNAILPTLQNKAVTVDGIQGFLWVKAEKFMALAEETDAKSLIDRMKAIAQQSFDEGVGLIKDLEKLRESLGSKYRIPREDYFNPNPFGRS